MNISRSNSANPVPGIEVRDLDYYYGGLKVLENIHLSVARGRSAAVLGPSGCGKSTLLHILAGLLSPEQGEVQFQGRSVLNRQGWISYMQQDDLLLPWKTVADNIALPLILKGQKAREARRSVLQQLSQFGLEGFGHHFPDQLSGGMRQRASFMRSCMFRQDFFLLDEPFSRLDYLTRSRMHEWFQNYVEEHQPGYILVTHDPEEALLLADEIILLSSRPARVIERFRVDHPRPRSRELIAREPMQEILRTIIAKAT